MSEQHDYKSEHMQSICEPCFAFRQQWTHTAGKVSAWKSAIGFMFDLAGSHFVASRGAEAHELKRLAEEFQKQYLKPLEAELDKFIKEGSQR